MKLIIISVVAAAAIGIIFMWMGQIGEGDLNELEVEIEVEGIVDTLTEDDAISLEDLEDDDEVEEIKVLAIDEAGNEMEGIYIEISGAGVNPPRDITDDDGEAEFKDDVNPNRTGEITITGEDPDTGREVSVTILVTE